VLKTSISKHPSPSPWKDIAQQLSDRSETECRRRWEVLNYETIKYSVNKDRIARIVLNRPERFNAINAELAKELELAVEEANRDDNVHVIIVEGSGKGFCGGFDLKEFAEGETPWNQDMPWDPLIDYRMMKQFSERFQSLWKSYKPTIAKVHGAAVAGGSELALSCDMTIMSEDARIGYPPARVWGCPVTGMWVHRLGVEKAKRMLLTGDIIDGKEAKNIGLVLDAVPADKLEEAVMKLAKRMSSVPKNQLMMQKLMINTAYENMGLATTQTLATLFDGVTRHSPEGIAFRQHAAKEGFPAAVKLRDSGDLIPGSKSTPPGL
jgi:enoyl-CoA hydratase